MIDPRLCFIAMPFSSDMENIYTAIEQVVNDYCSLKCIRADKIAGSNRITDDIRDNIRTARLVIADLTASNANVFYEVGMAHGRGTCVVLMVQKGNVVPFDLKGVRYLEYDPNELASLKPRLIEFVKTCIQTLPANWDRNYRPSDWTGAYIKITSLEAPSVVEFGQAFEIRVKARNNGPSADQGYFSVSFPDGVDSLSMESNAVSRIGLRGGAWMRDDLVLSYPIAEGFQYGEESPAWPSGKEYFINVRAYPKRTGLLWYYVNASSYDASLDGRRWDPRRRTLDKDQRDEDVYCGIIEVRKA